MFIWKDTKKRCNPYAAYTSPEGVTYAYVPMGLDLVEEIPDPIAPTPPDGYTVDEAFYRTEQDDAPYIIWTPKSDEQLTQLHNAKIDQQIDSMEGKYPRAMRELMMLYFVDKAVAAGIDPVDLLDPSKPAFAPGYAKVKQLDDQIAALRASKKK